MKKGFSTVLGVVIVLLIGAVGFVLWQQYASKNVESQNAQHDTMAGWKTYQNEVYGLEMEHPANWSVIRENKDVSLQNALKGFGGDKAEVVVLDEKSGSNVAVRYFGTSLNFGDCPSKISQEECLKLRKMNKIELDQFMGLGVFQNAKKTLLNGYNAYEIDSTPRGFIIMVENKGGEIFEISLAGHPTKNDLSPTELQALSTFKFTK